MARVLCIDCEPETVTTIKNAGHSAVSVELGYRTAKRNFRVPPHEHDLMVFDLKKPACFDMTYWGPGRNDNYRCKVVETLSNEAYLRDGHLLFKHRLIQDTQLPPVVPGTFGPDDILRSIKDGGIPFALFLNDEWVKRAASFPSIFTLSWTFKRTVATRISVDRILSDRLPGLGSDIKIAIPLRTAISKGPESLRSTQRVSCPSFALVTNSVKDVFAQVVTVGSGNIWLLPTFEDNGLVIARIASNLSAFRSAIVVRTEVKEAAPVPLGSQVSAVPKAASPEVGPDSRTVFVIHGRDERLRVGMFDFLRSLDLKPLEWTEAVKLTGKGSPYIGEILDTAFSRAQAVVVLFTPDDEARLRDALWTKGEPAYETQLTPQARPNVLFEAGMAMARDPDRTILVQIGDLRPFSDIAGRHTIRMDNSTDKRQDLALRLESAGCTVNLSGTDWQKTGDLTPPSLRSAPRDTGNPLSVGSDQSSPNIIGQQMPAPAAPVFPIPERRRSDIQPTATRVVRVAQVSYGVWSEDRYGQDAIVIQFTNEAKPGSRNAEALVRASLVYRDDQNELLRITGCWVNEATELAEFRVDETHKLIAGVLLGSPLVAMEKRRVRESLNSDVIQMEQHPLTGFQQGSVRVRLTNADTGDLLYEGQFRVNVNPLGIVPL